MSSVIIRILLRYGSGVLVAKGLLDPDSGVELSNDPDIQMALQVAAGVLAGAISEGWYYLARKYYWVK